MGYFRKIEYGDIIEIYDYEKDISTKPRKYLSKIKRDRQQKRRKLTISSKHYKRSYGSIQRARGAFFRLCHHNNIHSNTIHFITLTFAYDCNYKTACRHVSDFFSRVKKVYPQIPLRYIAVPELTKKGRYHFHLLVYDLPPLTASMERETRNFQRLYRAGYVDIRVATFTSQGIAGYMAKYMAKFLTDYKNEATRGYNCSRNIKKGTSIGFNSVDEYTALSIPKNVDVLRDVVYDVPYLGKCYHQKLKNK